MRRGYVFTLEAMGVFAAWMILLLFAWQYAGQAMNSATEELEIQTRERIAIETTDALLQRHSIQPWKGCAQFSEEKRRETPYLVDEKCLEKLKTNSLPEGVTRLVLYTPFGSQELAGEEMQGDCTILRRPFLLDGMTPSALEVSVCE